MNNINTLINNLKSKDHSLRDKSAISLMDIGNSIAVQPLIEAINKPENINHRGTLVYALSNFDCSDQLELLVNLILTGNFEVSTGAYQIIKDLNLSKEQNKIVKNLLNKLKTPNNHNSEGRRELLKLIS